MFLITATPMPHPAVVPPYDDIPDKLFGDIQTIIVHTNNNPRITTFATLPVPSPAAATPSTVATAVDEPSGEEVESDISDTKTD